MEKKNRKAVALFSGGLDSILAIKLVEKQGIFVQGLFFETPFFEHRKAKYFADKYGINLKIIYCFEEYKQVLLNPVCGYGKNMNPCIDCHAFMMRKSLEYMRKNNFDFIISGEVLGERPMSQNKNALNRVLKLSGAKGLVLRPLSAKVLEPTIPEINGWVERDMLEGITGRNRKRQFELAKEFGINEFPSPGGGCLLTDRGFSMRLRRLIDIWGEKIEDKLINLIKVGRMFNLDAKNILIVGRNKHENEIISNLFNADEDILIKPYNIKGPVCIIPKENINNEELLKCAVSICMRYSDIEKNSSGEATVFYRGKKMLLKEYPMEESIIRDKYLMPLHD